MRLLIIVLVGLALLFSGAVYAQDTGTTIDFESKDQDLWIRAVINTEEAGPIEAVWRQGGQAVTERGDEVVWGLFYASPDDVTWGSRDNPDLYVKIWFDQGGRLDVNFFHVSVPDIQVESAYYATDGSADQQGTTTMTSRYIRQYYENGQSFSDGQDEDGMPAPGYTQTNNPLAYETINRLDIGSSIISEEMGPIDAIWQLGGTDTTAAGDQVVWGHFYASPEDVNWGNSQNPDLFVKVWFDHSGRIDVNFFHVSVPDIEVYSDYPGDGSYDQAGTTTMVDRYIRQEYTSLEPEERSFYVIGDSWSDVPSRFNTFEACLSQRNLDYFTVYKHAVSGSSAAQWASDTFAPANAFLLALTEDPRPKPVVYFTLGANDLPGESIPANLDTLVGNILTARPDAKIIMASMDTLNPAISPACEAMYDVVQLNGGFNQLATLQAEVAANYPSAFAAYVMGTLQGTPGNPDLSQPGPVEYMGDCFHLNAEGYNLVVGQAIDLALLNTDFFSPEIAGTTPN
jgi:lysophospholipase L1-like esterase